MFCRLSFGGDRSTGVCTGMPGTVSKGLLTLLLKGWNDAEHGTRSQRESAGRRQRPRRPRAVRIGPRGSRMAAACSAARANRQLAADWRRAWHKDHPRRPVPVP